MKKRMLILAVVGMTGVMSAENMIKNGDFETAGNWTWDGDRKLTPFTFVTEDARGGKACMKLEKYACQGGVTLEKGKSYKLTVSVKCQDCKPDAFCVKFLKFKGGKPAGWLARNGVYQLIRTGGTHDWQEFSRVIKADEIGDGASGYLFISHEKPEGSIWVDNLSLEVLPEEE